MIQDVPVPFDYSTPTCFSTAFDMIAALLPEHVAVQFGDTKLTFSELQSMSNTVSHHLLNLGLVRGDKVATVLDNGVELVVAFVAIIRAGLVYIPIDPRSPQQRINTMRQESKARLTITSASNRTSTTGEDVLGSIVDMGQLLIPLGFAAREQTHPPIPPSAPAYMIFTSGTTGRPKAVVISHASLCQLPFAYVSSYLARDIERNFGDFRVALNASCAFDASIGALSLLLMGCTVCVLPQETRRSPSETIRFLSDESIDFVECSPTQMMMWIDAGFFEGHHPWTPRVISISGETLPQALWRDIQHKNTTCTRFINSYGPTECTVDSTYAEIDLASSIPMIGRPLPGRLVFVVDGRMQPVAPGVSGEIVIGGIGVGLGYENAPAQSAEKFVYAPHLCPGRVYKTGDFGRYGSNSQLEFLGRHDRQVKIRGFRIELDEISSCISKHSSVIASTVLLDKPSLEEPYRRDKLAAFLLLKKDVFLSSALKIDLVNHVKKFLPSYMVPDCFVVVDHFPMNLNGKLDESKLLEQLANETRTE